MNARAIERINCNPFIWTDLLLATIVFLTFHLFLSDMHLYSHFWFFAFSLPPMPRNFIPDYPILSSTLSYLILLCRVLCHLIPCYDMLSFPFPGFLFIYHYPTLYLLYEYHHIILSPDSLCPLPYLYAVPPYIFFINIIISSSLLIPSVLYPVYMLSHLISSSLISLHHSLLSLSVLYPICMLSHLIPSLLISLHHSLLSLSVPYPVCRLSRLWLAPQRIL